MGYRIDIDHGGCITCGICMDVCPVEALDMSRPDAPGVETGPGPGHPLAWMMEHPLQVGECIGCGICIRECPPNVMSLVTMSGEVPLAARQGPIDRPAEAPADGWVPLSQVTREVLKPVHDSPWGDLFTWRTRSRPKEWQVWTSMVDDAPRSPLAPCQEACPAGTDAGRYVGLIGAGRYDAAYAVAAEVNPFPSVCGWICTAPCEVACRRGVLDEPIAIRTLKRFAAEHGKLPAVEPPTVRRSEPVAIVGGGPAGMSAAWYLARLGYPCTVLEAMPVPGGMMAIGIPEYRLPRDVLQEEIARILAVGVELRLDTAMGRTSGWPTSSARGSGRSSSRPARPRADASGSPATSCAGSSQPRGSSRRSTSASRPACRVTSSSSAGAAPRLTRRGRHAGAARATVTIIYRRGRRDMPAQAEEIEDAEREGIVVLDGLGPNEVVGRDGAVVAVRCDVMLAPDDTSQAGRTGWAPTGEIRELPASAILVAIGEEPDPSILPEGAGIEVSGWGGNRCRSPDPRHGPGRDLRGRRRRVGAAHDHRGGRRRTARRQRPSTDYLAGAPDGEAEIFAPARAVSDGPETSPASTSRLVPGSSRRSGRGHRVASRPRRKASPTPRRMPRPAGASVATRSRLPSVQVVTGRGPGDCRARARQP